MLILIIFSLSKSVLHSATVQCERKLRAFNCKLFTTGAKHKFQGNLLETDYLSELHIFQ